MASRKSVNKPKKSFAFKAVIGGVCICIIAAIIGFASTVMLTPVQVSMGLSSSNTFQANITVSSDITPPSTLKQTQSEDSEATPNATDDASTAGTTGTADANNTTDASSAATTAHNTPTTSDVFADTLSRRTSLNELTPLNTAADYKTLSNRIEQKQREEEEARLAAERQHIQEVQEKQRAWGSNSALETVDFSVGEEAFVQEWTQRIDAYLAGSNLAGHGCDFAQAAWDYGVDPRWSPAISNTESGKGAHCFLPYNAWGWGASIWFNWTDAIYGHVKGLSDGYGYSITYAAASAYCPPNTDNWYQNTLNEMTKI